MDLTKQQRRKLSRRTTATSKARLRARYAGRGKVKPRKAKAKANPLLDPFTQLSGKTLRTAAENLTNLEFGAQKRALGREMAQATRQGTALASNASDYYRQLAGDVAGSVARQSAIGAELQNRLKSNAAGAQADLTQIDEEAAQRATQDAAIRGPGLDGGGQARVAAEVAAARGLAAQSAQSSQDQAAMAAYNYGNLQNLTGQATTAMGGETQRDILNALSSQQADIRGKQGDLSAQIAAKRAANILQLRQQGFENQVTQQGLGIDMAKIRSSERTAAANRRAAERQNRARLRTQRRGQDVSAFTQRRGQDVTARERSLDRKSREQIAAARAKSVGSKRAAESANSRKARNEIGNILSAIKTENWYRGRPKPAVLRRLRKQGATPLGAEIAYQLHITGWLGPDMMRRARAAGIRIPRAWKHPGGPYGSGIPHNKV